MEAIECARAVLKYTEDYELAVLLVAIAGAESNWRLDARGDAYGGNWCCNGYCSWGPWQIYIPAHYPWLSRFAGTDDPCNMAGWLTSSYENSALAALTVYQRQGPCAWTVYEEWCSPNHNGRYRNYLEQARVAVEAAMQPAPPQPPPVPPPPIPPLAPVAMALGAIGAVLTGGVGAGLILYAYRKQRLGGVLKSS